MGVGRKNNHPRIRSIDQVRGLAVVAMIFSHGLRWLHTGRSQDVLSVAGTNSIGDLATPIFFIISGLSLGLMARRKGINPAALLPKLIRLFIIGVLLTFSWGVLQAQAVGLAVVSFAYAFFPRVGDALGMAHTDGTGVSLLAVASWLLHVVVRGIVPWDHADWNHFFIGGFPVFGVIALIALGFLSSRYMRTKGWTRPILFVGVATFAGGIGLHTFGIALERTAMSPSFVLLGYGLTMMLIVLFETARERSRRRGGRGYFVRVLRGLEKMGTRALYLFIFHYMVVALPLHALGLAGRLNALPTLIGAFPLTVAIIHVGFRRGVETGKVYDRLDDVYVGVREWIDGCFARYILSRGWSRSERVSSRSDDGRYHTESG